MTALTHDTDSLQPIRRSSATGLAFAAVAAVTFGLSGALARPLLDSGWSAGAVVLARIGLGALVVLPFAAVELRGRWHLVVDHLGSLVLFGLTGVAAAQFCYFSAVQYLDVGTALLIEYTAPAAVVVWMWLRHSERPGPVTLAGAALAALGLLLVLDLFSGADFQVVGVAWALGAMTGAASFFIISADESIDLPPLSLAAGGLVFGALTLALLGALGLMPMRMHDTAVDYAGLTVAWWLPVLLLGVASAAIAYTAGTAAVRRLGSRVASFVGLSEVLAAVLWAWLLLGELPGAMQLLGGVLVLLGVIGVKLGETGVVATRPTAQEVTG